jgi:hypothetical protein
MEEAPLRLFRKKRVYDIVKLMGGKRLVPIRI